MYFFSFRYQYLRAIFLSGDHYMSKYLRCINLFSSGCATHFHTDSINSTFQSVPVEPSTFHISNYFRKRENYSKNQEGISSWKCKTERRTKNEELSDNNKSLETKYKSEIEKRKNPPRCEECNKAWRNINIPMRNGNRGHTQRSIRRISVMKVRKPSSS